MAGPGCDCFTVIRKSPVGVGVSWLADGDLILAGDLAVPHYLQSALARLITILESCAAPRGPVSSATCRSQPKPQSPRLVCKPRGLAFGSIPWRHASVAQCGDPEEGAGSPLPRPPQTDSGRQFTRTSLQRPPTGFLRTVREALAAGPVSIGSHWPWCLSALRCARRECPIPRTAPAPALPIAPPIMAPPAAPLAFG